MKKLSALIWIVFSLCTARIGFAIHGSYFWAIVDFFFTVFAWLKWILLGQVNITVIKHALGFFLQ